MKQRRKAVLDPAITRRLADLDAALAGGPADEELADLRDLVLTVQDERPVPRAEFARALDARARGGFETPGNAGAAAVRRRPSLRPRRLSPLAAGSAAAVFIVATAIFSGVLSGGSNDRGETGAPSGEVTRPLAAPAAAPQGSAEEDARSSAPAAAPVAPAGPSSGGAPRARERKVERGSSIALSAPPDRIEDVADGVIGTADRYGGFVASSSVASGDDDAGATIDLRIPTGRLDSAIADLSKLAHVRSRSQRSLDITARFSSPRRRLAEASAERSALLKQLAAAVTVNETASIKERLRLATRRIESARAALRRLENRVDYAAVAVTVEPGASEGGSGAWTAGDAFADALTVAQAIIGALLIALAVIVLPSLLVLLVWSARRAYLRRAREASLGAVEKEARR